MIIPATNYQIGSKCIETISIEGELNSVLRYNSLISSPYNVILGTNSSFKDSNTIQNRYIKKLIDAAKFPFFIVTGEFVNLHNKKLLFVGNQDKKPSPRLTNKIMQICDETNSDLQVLFVLNKNSPEVSNVVLDYYSEAFKNIELVSSQAFNSSKYAGIEKHTQKKPKDLIIIDNN